MSVEVGLRVVQGPHWRSGNVRGGEGQVGTLKQILKDGRIRVLWDNGQEVTCKAGADGTFELRILDTAPVGVQHKGTHCTGCQDRDVYGMVWLCTDTACTETPVTLCSTCYVTDKHDVTHVFERVDLQGVRGERVEKRSASWKLQSSGLFPGAKVKRGPDWAWGDQDGGPGAVGEVTGYENTAPTSSRNLVQVVWPSGVRNSYRVGYQGNVDLLCVGQTGGAFYYRDHLPVLDTTGCTPSPTCKVISTTAATSSPSSVSSSSAPIQSAPPRVSRDCWSGLGAGLALDLRVGDTVTIAVDKDMLKELQAMYGGVTAGMIQAIGKTGVVVAVMADMGIQVKFDRLTYRLNPRALSKVAVLSVGDTVRIQADVEQAKFINQCVGWNSEMDATCGRVARVVRTEDGVVAVVFARKVYRYAPACCQPVRGVEPDPLSSSREVSNHGAQSDSGNKQHNALHHKLTRMLAQMVQHEDNGSSGQDQDHSEMRELFKAITKGAAETVRHMCTKDTTLLQRAHQGMTSLMVACHEGKRGVINVLLDLGADVNTEGDHGNTALVAALEGKKESSALLLLKRGADVHHRNSEQRGAAHIAAYNNLGDSLREIVRQGADINYTDNDGNTPLHVAIDRNSKEAVDALLGSPELDLQRCNRKGLNMLQLACRQGNLHAVERILQKDKSHIDDLMVDEFNALQIAVNNDHVDCARVLIAEGGAALDIRGFKNLTALHLACNEAYLRSVELLVNSGADLNLQAADGNTPLHLALGSKSTQLRKNPSEAVLKLEHRNRVHMACLLLAKGAFIDATNHRGTKPLLCCRPETIRTPVKKFIQDHAQLIKRKGGARMNGQHN